MLIIVYHINLSKENNEFLSAVTLFLRLAPMQKKGFSLRAVTIFYIYMQSSDVQILIPLSRKKYH